METNQEMAKLIASAKEEHRHEQSKYESSVALAIDWQRRVRELDWEFCCLFVQLELGPFTPEMFRKSEVPVNFEKTFRFRIDVPGFERILASANRTDFEWKIESYSVINDNGCQVNVGTLKEALARLALAKQ